MTQITDNGLSKNTTEVDTRYIWALEVLEAVSSGHDVTDWVYRDARQIMREYEREAYDGHL